MSVNIKPIQDHQKQLLSEDDQNIWQKYISELFSKPEHKFQPMKGFDQTLSYKLDLHNLTIQQAFYTTKQFLEEHNINGSKYVIIISGKGGKINDELPTWCSNTGFVRKIEPITDKSGDHGAYIIYFYAKRSKYTNH